MNMYKRLYPCISDFLYEQDMDVHISCVYLLKTLRYTLCIPTKNYEVYKRLSVCITNIHEQI